MFRATNLQNGGIHLAQVLCNGKSVWVTCVFHYWINVRNHDFTDENYSVAAITPSLQFIQ